MKLFVFVVIFVALETETFATQQCSPVHCSDGCQQSTGNDGCPFCKCGADSGPVCTIPICDKDCRVDTYTHSCPTCICDKSQKPLELMQNYNAFKDPYCYLLKCGPGCVRAQTTSGPNERCPGCICQGRPGENITCGAMHCDLPCMFKRFIPDGCPACVCGMMPYSGK